MKGFYLFYFQQGLILNLFMVTSDCFLASFEGVLKTHEVDSAGLFGSGVNETDAIRDLRDNISGRVVVINGKDVKIPDFIKVI